MYYNLSPRNNNLQLYISGVGGTIQAMDAMDASISIDGFPCPHTPYCLSGFRKDMYYNSSPRRNNLQHYISGVGGTTQAMDAL